MGKVLWLSNETPDAHGQGGQRRQYFQIKAAVAAGHDVTVATLAGEQRDESIGQLAEVIRLPTPSRRFPMMRNTRTQDRLFSRRFDHIVVAHTESWVTWRRYLVGADAPVLVDMHNVLSAWHASQQRLEEAERWAQVEQEISRTADTISVCSAREAARLERRNVAALVLEHGISPEEWRIPPRPGPTPTLKLFGNWDWAPNTAGLSWFLSEVWPSLRERTALACSVSGAYSGSLQGDDRLRFVGRVSSVPRFLSDSWVVALPIRAGVGAPVKYAEALASGVPVMGTQDAVPTHSHLPGLVSDDPDDWVDWVQALLRSPDRPRERAEEARAQALSVLSWSHVSAPLLRWLDAE